MTLLSKASKAAVVSSAILVSFELALRLWWHPSLGPTEATLLAPHSERDWVLDPNNPTSQGVRFRLGEHGLREARQRADLAVARALAAAPSPTVAERVRPMELAGSGAAAVRVQAAVRGAAVQRQWRHVLVVMAR